MEPKLISVSPRASRPPGSQACLPAQGTEGSEPGAFSSAVMPRDLQWGSQASECISTTWRMRRGLLSHRWEGFLDPIPRVSASVEARQSAFITSSQKMLLVQGLALRCWSVRPGHSGHRSVPAGWASARHLSGIQVLRPCSQTSGRASRGAGSGIWV